MNPQTIRDFRVAKPFKPFCLVLESGERIAINQEYELAIATDNSHLIVCPANSPKTYHLKPADVIGADLISENRVA